MLNVSKPSFWPLSRPAQQPKVEPIQPDRLGDLMSQLDAGIAQSSAREAEKSKQGPAAPAESMAAEAKDATSEALAQAAPAVQPAPTVQPAPIAQPAPTVPLIAASEAPAPFVASEESFIDALRVVAEQRKAAEKLLFEACVLEERLKDESRVAHAVREYTVAKAKADRAAVAEEQASLFVREKAGVRAAFEAERKGLEDVLDAKRVEADAAKVKLEELERLVAQARASVAEMISSTTAHETYAKECIDKAAVAQRDEAQALDDLKARTSEREAAEADARAAQARAEELKQSLSTSRESGMETVSGLAARIAEQAKQMKNAA